MGLSRQSRMVIVGTFTFLFFLMEIITGYVAGSIALVADSFHMVSQRNN
jgi:zinc transporter 1